VTPYVLHNGIRLRRCVRFKLGPLETPGNSSWYTMGKGGYRVTDAVYAYRRKEKSIVLSGIEP
jgi:hypothetical protein